MSRILRDWALAVLGVTIFYALIVVAGALTTRSIWQGLAFAVGALGVCALVFRVTARKEGHR